MAEEPENIILHQLRGMREEQREFRSEMTEFRTETRANFRDVRNVQDEHTLHLQSLEERFELLREGTMSAIGFAAHADRQYRSLKDQIAELTQRVERLEKSK